MFKLYWKYLTADQFGWHMIPLPGASNKRKIIQGDHFSFGYACWVKEATRWNLLSAPEDFCCYHQTWTSENAKGKHIYYNTCQTQRIIAKKLCVLVISEVYTNLTLFVFTAKMKSSYTSWGKSCISTLFFRCHTHTHPTISVTVPELGQHQWMSVVGV